MSVASRIGLQLGLSDSASRLTLPTITRHAGKFLLSFAKWWTIGWLGYYLITDLNRRLTIRRRARELQATLSKPLHKGSRGSVNGDYASDQEPLGPLGVSRKEKEALKKQFASLHFLGRYWNPFAEWREQGAWVSLAILDYLLAVGCLIMAIDRRRPSLICSRPSRHSRSFDLLAMCLTFDPYQVSKTKRSTLSSCMGRETSFK